MDEQKKTYNYGYDEYQNDIRNLLEMIHVETKYDYHIIGVARGGLVPATHLSNLMDCKMSVMKFQTRHGNVDEKCEWYGKPEYVNPMDRFIVIDEIYDSGKTIKQIQSDISKSSVSKNQISYYTIYGNKKAHDDNVTYLHESNGRWIIFPWERL